MTNQPFFTRDGDRFQPTSASPGPWDPTSLHGRVIVGLLAERIETLHGGADYMPARLTVDMYRLPGLAPVTVATRLARDGWRIKVAEAEFFSDGVSMARASCQLLRRTANPPGHVWRREDWRVPAPADIKLPPDRRAALGGMWEILPISGFMGALGERRVWMREVRPLIDDEPMTPFTRAALAADFASPFANAGDAGLSYINSDATLYLHRLPVGEWIGMEVVDHGATDGVAVASCRMHDEHGAIGEASVAALAQKSKMIG